MIDPHLIFPTDERPSVQVEKALATLLLAPAVHDLNTNSLRRRMSLFTDDRLPTNQRNLTDFRGRIGFLIEYELARSIDEILKNKVERACSISYVLANRFPDLEIRGEDGSTGLRLEVKTIDVLAEEKSANYHTLIKDVIPGSDYVIVLLWRWSSPQEDQVRYPFVEEFFVLNAYELALMRDARWLSSPPNVGNGLQGFDIRWAVNSSPTGYNQEEGNLGKLMRIADQDTRTKVRTGSIRDETWNTYFKLCSTAIAEGHRAISKLVEDSLSSSLNVQVESEPIESEDEELLQFRIVAPGLELVILCGLTRMPTRRAINDAAVDRVSYILVQNPKFQWQIFDANLQPVGRGRKPGEAIKKILELAVTR